MNPEAYAEWFVKSAFAAVKADTGSVFTKSATSYPTLQKLLTEAHRELSRTDPFSRMSIVSKVSERLHIPQDEDFVEVLKSGSVDSFIRVATDIQNFINQIRQGQNKK